MEIEQQRLTAALGYSHLDPFGEEGAEERVGRAADQHQDVEQRKAHRDPPGPHPGNARGIGQRPDQVDRRSKQADDKELAIHAGLLTPRVVPGQHCRQSSTDSGQAASRAVSPIR